jgi:major membrane immunogen (membrane-anchored lipoprotein)
VNNGQITICEFDARNLSGFRRSWDMDYMLGWQSASGSGVRLSNYIISYQNSLVTLQDPRKIQPIPGSRNVHDVFVNLAENAIAQAKSGKRGVVFVKLPEKLYPANI